MATYKIYPTQDTTLYSQYPNLNSGRDEILEVSSYFYTGTKYNSRYLIQFSTTEIQDVIDNKVTSSFDITLNTKIANISGLSSDTTVYFYEVSGSWDMGTGHYKDNPIVTNGSSWNWKDYSGSILWVTEGGDFYSTPVYSQSYSYYTQDDINVSVKTSVMSWYSGSKDNHGFIAKLTSSVEESNNLNIQPIFKYFSRDTHTIYPPYLEFKWDDYTFNTGSSTNTTLNTPEAFMSIYNNAGVYYSESIARFRVAAIPKYPDRQFITSSYYTENFYLPESNSYYAIKDAHTNEFVVNFDSTYTRISADATSSYFNIYMNGLEPERYYTILIKSSIGGVTKVWDEDIQFKVEKGD